MNNDSLLSLLVPGGDILEVSNSLPFASMENRQLAARLIDQNPTHRLGGCSKEMSAACEGGSSDVSHQPQVCLMYQGSRLQSLPRFLLRQFRRRQLPQFLIH